MTTYQITYETGATNKVMTATGRDLLDALRNAGVKNAEAFSWSRVVTYRELDECDCCGQMKPEVALVHIAYAGDTSACTDCRNSDY